MTMTATQISVYTLLMCGIVCGIAATMETYKKVLRDGKSKKWENLIIGMLFSCFSVFLLAISKVLVPILGILGAPLWADYVLYVLGIFILQLNVNMKIVKKIVKTIVSNLLKKANFTEEQINDIFNAVEK